MLEGWNPLSHVGMPFVRATQCRQSETVQGTKIIYPCAEPRTILGIPMIPCGPYTADRLQWVFTDTCHLDNTMMILSYLYEHDSIFRYFLQMRDLKEKRYMRQCVQLIREHKFNLARRLWLESMLKRKALKVPNENSLRGSEYHVAISPLSALFKGYYERRQCILHGDQHFSFRSPLDVVFKTVGETVSYLNGSFCKK